MQIDGIDYNETFSLLVKMTSIRCILAIALNNERGLLKLDVNDYFLHGDLNEEVLHEIFSWPCTSFF